MTLLPKTVSRNGVQPDHQKDTYICLYHAPITRNFIISRYHTLPGKIFTLHYSGIQAIKKNHIYKAQVDVEHHIPETVPLSKVH